VATATREAAWRPGAADGWHEDLLWYAAAVHQMKVATPGLAEFQAMLPDQFERDAQEPPLPAPPELQAIIRSWSDPRSLGYQAQVHATYLQSGWPSHAGQRVLWTECAHGHWFFLPWHRAYLLEFESVARSIIDELGGPAQEWGLPYWNYSDYRTNPQVVELPHPFRGETLPSGVTVPGMGGDRRNPLFDPTRVMIGPPLTEPRSWADAGPALRRRHYANQQDTGRVSFAGGVLEDPARFHGWNELGAVDRQPHGSVHGQVGGSMGGFRTAALDPIFWLHHANVDRLWETYANDLGHGYPFEPVGDPNTAAHQSWVSRPLRFLRPDGEVATWTAPQLLRVEALGYRYDTTEPPPLPPPLAPIPGEEDDPFGLEAPVPEPIAATVDVPLAQASTVMLTSGDDGGVGLGGAGQRWVLRFDGIRAARPAPTSYDLYLGLSAGDPVSPDDETHYVGLLSLFGVFEASLDDGTGPGSGDRRHFDVTEQVNALGAGFDPLHTSLRLEPLNPDRDLEAARMSVGRITLEVA
jgi:tyrosinase